MSYTKHGLRAFGLCFLAALSAMAVTAAGAQAKGDWRINTSTTTGTVGFTVTADGAVKLLSTFGAANTAIEISCFGVAADDGLLFVGGGSSATLLFSKCQVFVEKSGTPSKTCVAKEPITAKVKGLLIKHGFNETYILLSPLTGSAFTTVDLGELCAVGEEIEITGSLVLECGILTCEKEEAFHLISDVFSLLLFEDRLSFGKHAADIDGSAVLTLSSPNTGKSWSGLAL